MIIIYMLHRVSHPNDPHRWPRVASWLSQVVQRYPIVNPGEPLKPGVNICLTFDDAYADFYYYVFPWLKQYNCPATVAVPTGMILEDTTVAMAQRLLIPEQQAFALQNWQCGSFCTWQELKAMAASGLVNLASHGYHHIGSASPQFDTYMEMVHSQQLIYQHCGVIPTTYIYPYGGFHSVRHRVACQHYDYLMRISGAANSSWRSSLQLLYRVNADAWWQQGRLPGVLQCMQWSVKGWLNQRRGK